MLTADLLNVNNKFPLAAQRHLASVAEAIQHHRERLGLTQLQLGVRVGVSRQSVIKWEAGKQPSEKHVKRLAELFHVTPSELRYPNAEPAPQVVVLEPARAYGAHSRRLVPRVYEVVFGYLDRMKKAGCSDEQVAEAERIMSDTAYSQLYKKSRREKTEDDQIMDIHAAWKFIAEVIERTEGKKL